ncbi:MAG: hypothetical protein A2014_06185 [Spirochaetes bacterium GWF1_49_6]|nr:MAG: hypothetical protein A2014_06185 [Spirochaetes bacterium GWF1_49_6]
MKKLLIAGFLLCVSSAYAAANTHEITVLLGRWNTLYWTGSSQIIYRTPDLFGLPLRIGAGIAGYGSLYIISDGNYEIWAHGEYGLYSGSVFHIYAGAGGVFYQSFPLKMTSFQPVILAGIAARLGFFNPEAVVRFRFYSDGWMVSLIQDYRFSLGDTLFFTIHPNFHLAGYYNFRNTELRAEFYAGFGLKI